MRLAKKSSGFRPIIILSYFHGYEPPVVATIYGKHNISVFLIFFVPPVLWVPLQLSNFYEKNPQSTAYFILDTKFFLCL